MRWISLLLLVCIIATPLCGCDKPNLSSDELIALVKYHEQYHIDWVRQVHGVGNIYRQEWTCRYEGNGRWFIELHYYGYSMIVVPLAGYEIRNIEVPTRLAIKWYFYERIGTFEHLGHSKETYPWPGLKLGSAQQGEISY